MDNYITRGNQKRFWTLKNTYISQEVHIFNLEVIIFFCRYTEVFKKEIMKIPNGRTIDKTISLIKKNNDERT